VIAVATSTRDGPPIRGRIDRDANVDLCQHPLARANAKNTKTTDDVAETTNGATRPLAR
jgi:hypothetical protein